jgi:hypothetical protein
MLYLAPPDPGRRLVWLERGGAADGPDRTLVVARLGEHEREALSRSAKEPAGTSKITTPSDREIRVERVFDAPRDRVWKAFTDPQLIAQWWG